jgi:hypothetical protein
MKPVHRYQSEIVGRFTEGSHLTLVTDDTIQWGIGIGMATRPSDSKGYVRVLTVQREVLGSDEKPTGLVLEGNPIYPLYVPNRNMTSGVYYSEGTIQTQDQVWNIMQVVVTILQKFGSLNGNQVVSAAAVAEYFSNGTMDRAITSVLEGTHEDFLYEVDPDSVGSFPDLDYEIGLGLDKVPTHNACAMVEAQASSTHFGEGFVEPINRFDYSGILQTVRSMFICGKHEQLLRELSANPFWGGNLTPEPDPGQAFATTQVGGELLRVFTTRSYLLSFSQGFDKDYGSWSCRLNNARGRYWNVGRLFVLPHVPDPKVWDYVKRAEPLDYLDTRLRVQNSG